MSAISSELIGGLERAELASFRQIMRGNRKMGNNSQKKHQAGLAFWR